MKKNYTHITVILDRSGSMTNIKNDIIGGFNEYINKQKKLPGKCTVSLVQFDDEYQTIFTGLNIKEVTNLSVENYVPRGMTALYDAACRAIDDTDSFIGWIPAKDRPSRVAVVIITDGQENSSRQFKKLDLINRIKYRVDNCNWSVAYIGSDIETMHDANAIGVAIRSTYVYDHTPIGTQQMFHVLGCSTAHYRDGTSNSLDLSNQDSTTMSKN